MIDEPGLVCDRCGNPIKGEGRGHDVIEFTNLHVAAGNQTTTYTAGTGDEEQDWDPESEYDFCEECETAWYAAFKAFMGAERRAA